jgi:peptide/nickel transport system permease protein
MVTKEGVQFQLRRVRGLLGTLLRNKMSVVGIVLLIIFSFMALGSPLLTPYQPNQQVSGVLAQPEWVMNFPDGYYLSRNIVVANDPFFNSPSALQEWTYTASPATLANLQISYASGVASIPSSGGSLFIRYSGSGPADVVISKTFDFPYHGPPADFIASLSLLVSGSTVQQTIHYRLFIDRIGDPAGVYNIQNLNDTLNGSWVPSEGSILGSNQGVKSALGTVNSPLSPAQIIFSSNQQYSYGIDLSFTGPQTANIDNFQLKLLGTAFGLLGTDNGGRDLYTQNIYGSRISLLVGLVAAGIGIGLGLIIGLMAGFLGRYVDEVLMRFTDMMLTIPSLPLLIVLIAVLGSSIWNVILIIGFFGWMGFARVIRSQVLTLRERPFVEAAKAAGAGPGRIMTKHILPNLISLTYVNLALSVPAAILTEAALAFLGLSDPTVVSWGHIFQNIENAGALSSNPVPWWWILPPGFLIALVSLSFILVGYALDEIFNPKLRRRR